MSWSKAIMEKEPPEPQNPIGTVVIGNLEPDMHELPREMVRKSLKRASFSTVISEKSFTCNLCGEG